jgi:hypothetical protein
MASTIEGFSTARPEGDHKKTTRSWRVSGGLSALTHEPAQTNRRAGKPKQKPNLKQEKPMQTKQSVTISYNHLPS